MNARLLLALPALALLALACEEPAKTTEGAFSELEPDCVTCLESLAECSSTAKNESQFVECRDVFGDCQVRMNLGPEDCGRPNNDIACELCQERATGCEGAECELEFDVCKAFLMSRNQDSCSKEALPAFGDCGVCVEALAGCAFAGDDPGVCEKIFFTCRNENQIEPAVCPGPSVVESCEACASRHEACEASSGEACDAGWTSCVGIMATEGACGAGPSEVEPTTCSHDACTAGEKMSAGCDSCVAAVCNEDPFCCETEYDDLCVVRAQNLAECGCAPIDTCEHNVCVAGDALDPECNECAADVCAADGFCCTTEWDDLCVSAAATSCGGCE